MGRILADALVEFHAGYKGDETPRAVVFEGNRLEVASVLWRKRIADSVSGKRWEVWRCRLVNGLVVSIELAANGSWRVFSVV